MKVDGVWQKDPWSTQRKVSQSLVRSKKNLLANLPLAVAVSALALMRNIPSLHRRPPRMRPYIMMNPCISLSLIVFRWFCLRRVVNVMSYMNQKEYLSEWGCSHFTKYGSPFGKQVHFKNDLFKPDFSIGIIIPCLTWPSSSYEMALSWPQSASRSERAKGLDGSPRWNPFSLCSLKT